MSTAETILSMNLGGVRLRRTLTFLPIRISGLDGFRLGDYSSERVSPHQWMGSWHRFASDFWRCSLSMILADSWAQCANAIAAFSFCRPALTRL